MAIASKCRSCCREQLNSVPGTLSEREAGVVSMRFGLTDGQPKTLGEIGKVTWERIRRVESKTMSKLCCISARASWGEPCGGYRRYPGTRNVYGLPFPLSSA